MARERERSMDAERTEHEPSGSEAGRAREPGEPDRAGAVTAGVRDPVQTDHASTERGMGTSARVPGSDGERAQDSGPSR